MSDNDKNRKQRTEKTIKQKNSISADAFESPQEQREIFI